MKIINHKTKKTTAFNSDSPKLAIRYILYNKLLPEDFTAIDFKDTWECNYFWEGVAKSLDAEKYKDDDIKLLTHEELM